MESDEFGKLGFGSILNGTNPNGWAAPRIGNGDYSNGIVGIDITQEWEGGNDVI